MIHEIAFPGLGLTFTLDRVAFTIGNKPIYWYGIIIAVGFLLGALYAMRRAPQFDLKAENLLDMLLFAVPVSILCARLYYVAFHGGWSRFFYIWEGGLAIYGGVIGAMATVAVFCRVRHLCARDMMDVGVLGLLIGQCIGRWGNFVNAEAYGGVTDALWRMSIDGGPGVHPTFLYESLWNLVGFCLLHWLSHHRRFSGETALQYVAWYGLGRTFIEGMRTDSLYLWGTGIRVSQALAAVTCLAAVAILIWQYKKQKKEEHKERGQS